jgi:CRISPR-associated exonuclease Cas4
MLSPFGKISGVNYIKDRLLFPINWLQKQDYCEYQIYLENIRGIKARPTRAMVTGQEEHQELYRRFAEKAVPSTPEKMLTESKTANLLSREFKIIDGAHGIFGYIDEVWLTPETFVVIDDKPGVRPYLSCIHQVFGYCLAFKTIIDSGDKRGLVAALRERGTDHLFWQAPFDKAAEEEIIVTVERIHALLAGQAEFKASDNPRKCQVCRLKVHCDKVLC